MPTAPSIEIESMFDVVAEPHGAGTSPNQIASPTTTSVAVDAGVIVSASA